MSSSGINLQPSSSKDKYIQHGWFGEQPNEMWPGQMICLEVEEVLLNGKSEFQDILLFKSKTYGKVLVLDGAIQVTERDEFAYQEMITHLPLFAHPNPKKVLIIGGGDGGVLREVIKHPGLTDIHMCEIDRQVVEVSKVYFSDSMATAFNDPRLTLIFDDAAKYLKDPQTLAQQYDVIICDSSDPIGPADVLFQPEFFLSMKHALNPEHGIICTQGECIWLHMDLIERVYKELKTIFPKVSYGYTTIPTYPSGQIGFMIASCDGSNPLHQPKRNTEGMALKYYSSRLHPAAFILPKFAEDRLGQHL